MTDSAYQPPAVDPPPPLSAGELPFAAAFLDHGHIHGQIQNLKQAGATLRYVYDPDPAKVKACVERNPEVEVVDDFERILDDPARGEGKRVFLVTADGEYEIPCKGRVYLPFYDVMVRDVIHRTERAMSQDTAFLIAELSLQAQVFADSRS